MCVTNRAPAILYRRSTDGFVQYNLRAACMTRGAYPNKDCSYPAPAPFVEVMRPNEPDVTLVSGRSNVARLKALNISQRNWRRYRSLNGKFLSILRSALLTPGPCNTLRPELPNVPAAAG